MIQTAGAKYFDGISSRPQPLLVRCDEQAETLNLRHDDNGIEQKWIFRDLLLHKTHRDFLEVRHRHFPGKLVEIQDAAFISQFDALLKERGYRSWYRILVQGGMRVHLLLAACIIGILLVSYFFLVPFIAEKAVSIIPRSYDVMIGEKLLSSFTDMDKVDSSKTALVNDFAAEHDFQAGIPIRFLVIRSPIENAFALPDGHVVIYTGMLNLVSDASELSALMAHEAAHIKNRHSMRLLCRNLAGYILISVALSDVNGIMAVVADHANTLRSLNYSRAFEKDADLDGLNLLRENHVDPKGMVKLFKKLKEEDTEFIPAFLTTHPLTNDRIEYLEKSAMRDPAPEANPTMERIFKQIKGE